MTPHPGHSSTGDRYFYEPAVGHGLPHSPFNAIIAPRPIGWISSQSTDGVLNLAPYAFFNAFNYEPPIIGFASNGAKDSVRNIEATGEFCWNLASGDLAQQMNSTAAVVPPDVDEFQLAGLSPRASRTISAPHVAEAKAVFECRLTQVVPLVSASGERTVTRMVFGEVVGVHIERSLLKEGIFQTAQADPLLRGGGPADYFRIRGEDLLRMHRP